MKLELKHLAPYLPYGLKWKNLVVGKENEVIGLEVVKGELRIRTNDGLYGYHSEKMKPILRPLSELTKEDAVNFDYVDEEHLKRSVIVGHAPFDVFNELLKEHFDVFDLIKNGLALDINEINKK